jgi:hypothetical protein
MSDLLNRRLIHEGRDDLLLGDDNDTVGGLDAKSW